MTGSAWRAGRAGAERVGEKHAIGGKAVEAGGLYYRVTDAAQVVSPMIVSQYVDYVWSFSAHVGDSSASARGALEKEHPATLSQGARQLRSVPIYTVRRTLPERLARTFRHLSCQAHSHRRPNLFLCQGHQ